MPPSKAQVAKAQLELLQREAARRRLMAFVRRLNAQYLPGWVHEDICRRLEQFSDDVTKGLSPRLMLLMPPRSGKSELASRMFPAWHLGRNPDHEIISCGYNVSLAMTFSRKVKEAIESPEYQTVFDTRLHPDFRSNEEWALANGRGGYVAAGVGGGITGRGCFSLDTTVKTRSGIIPMSQLQVGDHVLSYDHETGQAVFSPILAIHAARHPVGTGVYCGVRCTDDHPIYSPETKRYHPAAVVEQRGLPVMRWSEVEELEGVHDLQSGAPPAAGRPQDVPGVRGAESHTRSDVLDLLPERAQCSSYVGVRAMPRALQPGGGGGGEEGSEVHEPLLLQGVRGGLPRTAEGPGCVCTLQQAFGQQGPEGVLRPGMLRRAQAWVEHLGYWVRRGVQRCLSEAEAPGTGAGRPGVRHDRGQADTGGTPYRPRPEEQPAGKPDYVVEGGARAISRNAGCTAGVLAAHVSRAGGEPHVVVDVQTGTGNLFADGVLAHNCHILLIDDPIKNAEEADSAETREKLWDWYGSTAYTRLAPGGGVLCIQTHWHDDDLAGRLKAAMAADEEADQFVVVKYPAIAEEDEYLDYDTDLIVCGAAPDNGRLLRRQGDALHPDRYDLAKLNRIRRTISPRFWSALYQQNPVPDDGGYFTKDQFRSAPPPSLKLSNVFIAWDFAISEKKQNDYTVGTVALQDFDDVLHVVDQVRFKSGDAFYIVESILNLASRWHNSSLVVGFEDGQIYRSIEALLKKRMKERGFYPSTVVLKPITDKLARGRALQGRMQQGMVSFASGAPWADSLRTEMLRFPAGAHDDQVDSLSWAAQLAVGREAPRRPTSQKPKSWKDKLRDNGTLSHMVA